jgi:hypothetical protein
MTGGTVQLCLSEPAGGGPLAAAGVAPPAATGPAALLPWGGHSPRRFATIVEWVTCWP